MHETARESDYDHPWRLVLIVLCWFYSVHFYVPGLVFLHLLNQLGSVKR